MMFVAEYGQKLVHYRMELCKEWLNRELRCSTLMVSKNYIRGINISGQECSGESSWLIWWLFSRDIDFGETKVKELLQRVTNWQWIASTEA